jgi:hypothetical protein
VSERDAGDLRQRLEQLERLIHEMEEGPESPARARARQIVRAALDLHTDALARMLEIVRTGAAAGPALVDALAADPLVAGLLLLHGLHPLDLKTRVRAAVEDLAPVLRGQAARVAFVAVDDGAVRVRVERDAGRAGLPAAALRTRVEESILAIAPDAVSLEIDVPADAERAAFVPVEQVRLRSRTPEARRA